MQLLKKVNNFVSERAQLAMETAIDITKTTTESFTPLKKHLPGIAVKFLEGQKDLFEKRRRIRDSLLS